MCASTFIGAAQYPPVTPEATPGPAVSVIVAARNEADRIGATVDALRATFPGADVWVADDASEDGTSEAAMARGAKVVSRGRPHGKGANVTAAAEALLSEGEPAGVVLLCDGDLGETAGRLAPLVASVADGESDLAIAAFARRVGGGFGIALSFSRWATERLGGVTLGAPISGQRAIRGDRLRALLPFARGYGMETAMNIDAARAGLWLGEVELELEHRASGRTLGGFIHRGRQLADFLRVYVSRRFGRRRG
jgi:glycosyltransferase involved in cell wall biosynthesis